MGWLGDLGFVIDVYQLVWIFLSIMGVGYIGLGCCRFCGLFSCVTVFGLGFITFLYSILSQTYYIILDMYNSLLSNIIIACTIKMRIIPKSIPPQEPLSSNLYYNNTLHLSTCYQTYV